VVAETTYDGLGRKLTVSNPHYTGDRSRTIVCTYDKNGNMETKQDGRYTRTYVEERKP
jgi:hypothetical protein